MHRMRWGLAAAVSVVAGLAPVAAVADCPADLSKAVRPNPVCRVLALGWRVAAPEPPVRFQPNDGFPGVELAILPYARPKADLIRRAKTEFGGFGSFGDCGDLPDGTKFAWVSCTVPPGPGGRREGGMIAVDLLNGWQVGGLVVPEGTDLQALIQTRVRPLINLMAEGRVVGITEERARDAMFGGREYYLAPGAGIPASAIEGVYHNWNWGAAANFGMVDYGADYVFFRNGETWRKPDAAPQDIDPAKAKEARRQDWGTWRRAGNDVVLTMNGKAEERFAPDRLIRYEPAGADQRVEGSWRSSLGGVGQTAGNTAITSVSRSITLHADGRFERGGFSSASFSSQNAAGTFATTAPARNGRYRINGYILELTYDDGRRDSAIFYWAGGKDDRYGMLFINGEKFLGGLSR